MTKAINLTRIAIADPKPGLLKGIKFNNIALSKLNNMAQLPQMLLVDKYDRINGCIEQAVFASTIAEGKLAFTDQDDGLIETVEYDRVVRITVNDDLIVVVIRDDCGKEHSYESTDLLF